MKKFLYIILASLVGVMGCSDDKSGPSNLSYSPSAYRITVGEGFSTKYPSIQGAVPITYSLKDGLNAFKINASTGVISLPEGNALEAGTYSISVAASNGDGSSTFDEVILVIIDNIYDVEGEEAPSNLRYGTTAYEVLEAAAFTSTPPTIVSEKKVTYSLAENYDDFNIDPETGVVSLAEEHGLALGSYTLDIIVTCNGVHTTFKDALNVTIYAPLPNDLADKGYVLIWSDEFDGTTLDLEKWNYRYVNELRGYATYAKENVKVNGDGTLSLLFTESNGQYYVGMIGTSTLFTAKYGYFECRAKMQKSIGPHSSFWLQSPLYGKTGNPAVDGAEIDILEYLVNNPKNLYQTVHWNTYSSDDYKKEVYTHKQDGLGEGYHTFGLEWTAQGYSFYVDGVKTCTITQGISQVEQYLILSLTLNSWGGSGDGSDLSTSNKESWSVPDEIVFDYVRVFQK